MQYPAILYQTDSGNEITFPDFPGCVTYADTQNEAFDNAVEALNLHISGMQEDGESLPAPSVIDNISVDWDSDWTTNVKAVLMVPAAIRQTVPVHKRINITLNQDLLKTIDQTVQEYGLSRSGFLADAAKQRLTSMGHLNIE